jgi:hypothetical protein
VIDSPVVRAHRAAQLLLSTSIVVVAASCGESPAPSPSPSPTPGPTYHAAVVVFYDENGDGGRGDDETAVVPNVGVKIGGKDGVSQPGSGYVALDGVPGGTQPVTIGAMPPFYTAGAPVSLTVPQPSGVEFYVPMDLPIGGNRPGVYMAFGDSITDGDGSNDGQGYRSPLQRIIRGRSTTGRSAGLGATTARAGSTGPWRPRRRPTC